MINRELLFFCTMCRNKSDEDLARIQCTIQHSVKRFGRGEYIAYQNDTVRYLYMLTRGSVRTEMVSSSGLTLSVEEIKAPYPLAVAFLFADNNKFPVDVIAIDECEVLLITKSSVEEQMAKCPGFLRGFLAFSANRMEFLSTRLRVFAHKGIKAKVAYHILSVEHNGDFTLGRSVAALADYFGVERPSLSRALSELVRDGIITYKQGAGRVLNQNALHDLLR